MTLLYIVNLIASFIASGGLTYAVFSKHVCDGILIKKGLCAAAIGFVANGLQPNLHSQVWIACSMAAIMLFAVIRIAAARVRHKKPVFLVF